MSIDGFKTLVKSGEYLARYLEETGRGPIQRGREVQISCPDGAQHAHGDKNKSARYYPGPDEHIHCHGCGGNWDLFALVQRDEGCDFMSAVQSVARRFGLAAPACRSGTQGSASAPAPGAVSDVSRYVQECAAAGAGSVEYMRARGISEATARRFGIGFDRAEGRVVFPCGTGYYTSRAVDDSAPGLRYKFPKGIKPEPFNASALWESAGAPVFVVEGAIDALSIVEAGGVALALCGVTHWRALVDVIKSDGRAVPVPVIVAFDNETDPRTASNVAAQASKAREALRDCGVWVFEPSAWIPGYHDPNDALTRAAAVLRAEVARVAESAAQAFAHFKSADGSAGADIWGRDVGGVCLRRFADIPSTVPEDEDPDSLIRNFGLAKGEGWIVGGEPGVGKSSLIQQMAICAAAGKPFFGFEFARPLKVFYLQTELQSRKLKGADNSFSYAMRALFNWGEDDISRAREGVVYDEYMIGNVCQDITAYLLKVYSLYPFDLLIVDPLLTFAPGDLSLQPEAREFLYVQMNKLCGGRVYKTANGSPVKFGVVILAHMGKQSKDKNGNVINRGQYSTAGSYVINAWARFQLNLTRDKGGLYLLEAVKNPEVAQWRDGSGAWTDKLYIKRAGRGERYWTAATQQEIVEASANVAPVPADILADVRTLAARLNEGPALPATEVRKIARELLRGRKGGSADGDHWSDKVFDMIRKNPAAFGVAYEKDGRRELYGGRKRPAAGGRLMADDLPGIEVPDVSASETNRARSADRDEVSRYPIAPAASTGDDLEDIVF